MYHPASRRRQLIARTLVYAAMTITVLVIVTISIFIILGYSFNRKDGRIEQGGLLQFASKPSGAMVTVDGALLGSRTPTKTTTDAKSHFVTFTRDGYRPWQKSITIKPGGIGWLSYAHLVPTDIKPEAVHAFATVAQSLASPDQKWIAVLAASNSPDMTLVDISSSTPKYTTLSVPETLLTTPTTGGVITYDIVAWNHDSNRLLVKRTYDTDKVEWLLIDRTNTNASTNLTTSTALPIASVRFGDNSGHTVFIQSTDGIVRTLHTDDKTISEPLAEHVSEFSVYDESTLVYVLAPDEATGVITVGYRTRDMSAPQTIMTYPAGTSAVHAAFGEYFGTRYVATTNNQTMTVYTGTLPTQDVVAKLKTVSTSPLVSPASRLVISSNDRFVISTTTSGYATYDIELKKTDATNFQRASAHGQAVIWLDDYLAASDRAGTLRFAEFDGANQQDIMPVIEGQAMTLTDDDTYIYGFAQAPDGVALTRAKLILN